MNPLARLRNHVTGAIERGEAVAIVEQRKLETSGPKRRIKQNIWGNWNGYEGTRKVREFGTDKWDAELWVKGELDEIEEERKMEHSRTILASSEPWPFLKAPLQSSKTPARKKRSKKLPDALL